MTELLVYSYFCPATSERHGGVQQVVPPLLDGLVASGSWSVRVAHSGPCDRRDRHHVLPDLAETGERDQVSADSLVEHARLLRDLARSADVLLSIDRVLPPVDACPQVLMCNTLAYVTESDAACATSWDSIVVPTRSFERKVADLNPHVPTSVVPYGIPVETLRRATTMAPPPVPPHGTRVWLPHRPDQRKGHREAIEGLAAASAPSRRHEMHISWLHEGRYETYLRELGALARLSGVADRVHFEDWSNGDNRWRRMETAHAVVGLGSFVETFGLAVVEAILCGRLAITRPQPAVREVVGGTPLLVEIDDPSRWVDAMDSALERIRDATVLADARRRLCNFTTERMIAGYDHVLSGAVAAR